MKREDSALTTARAGTARSWLRHRLRDLLTALAPADSLRQQRWRLLARSGQGRRDPVRAGVQRVSGR